MSAQSQLFRIDPESKASQPVADADFARLGLRERHDIQEWIAENPAILDEDLLIIGKEFSGFDRTNERLDLLAVDPDGTLVIIELKRDDSGSDAHWQAIKYASYLRGASADNIVSILAAYKGVSQDEASDALLEHLESDDFARLNRSQRIILASHRFAPEVTSAALWLNENAPGSDLITCVQLTPHQDGEALYIQANTIIPLPSQDAYAVSVVGPEGEVDAARIAPASAKSNARSNARIHRNDDVSRFCNKVRDRAFAELPDELKPDDVDDWARDNRRGRRYYRISYRRLHWQIGWFGYVLHVTENPESRVIVNFEIQKRYARNDLGYSDGEIDELMTFARGLYNFSDIENSRGWRRAEAVFPADELTDAVADEAAAALREMIKAVTPAVERFHAERGAGDAP